MRSSEGKEVTGNFKERCVLDYAGKEFSSEMKCLNGER
jgi:hypothetical protein